MGLLLRVNVDAPDDVLRDYGAGAKLYWARDNTSSTGSFADASGSTAIVDGQSQYEIFDATGQDGHWYRTRVGDSGGTSFSAWDGPFQGGSLLAYATVDALREALELPDHSNDNYLADVLRRASAIIDAECGRDFYRHPQVSGTEVRTYHVTSVTDTIEDDIISISQVEYAPATAEPYSILASGYVLVPSVVDNVPYDALVLTGLGAITQFEAGYATVRLTGVFGFETVPTIVEAATIQLAVETWAVEHGSRTVGLEFGRMPSAVEVVKRKFKKRTYAWV